MSVVINNATISAWAPFLDDDSVKITVDPVVEGSTTGPSCTNNQFWGLKFASSENKAAFGQALPPAEGSALLSLKNDDPSFKKSLGDILGVVGLEDALINPPDADNEVTLFDKLVKLFLSTDFSLATQSATGKIEKDIRNATWITPGDELMRVDTALTMRPSAASNTIVQDLINPLLHINLTDVVADLPLLIVQRTSRGVKTQLDPSVEYRVSTTYRVTWKFVVGDYIFWISFEPSGMSVSITPSEDDSQRSHPDPYFGKISSLIGVTNVKPTSNFIPDTDDIPVSLLRFKASQQLSASPWWSVLASVKISDGGPDLYLSYNSQTSTFSGGLILASFFSEADDFLLPYYLPGVDLDLPDGKTYPTVWDLRDMFKGASMASVPSALPTGVTIMAVSFQNQGFLAFSADLIRIPANADAADDKTLPSPFTWDNLSVLLVKGQTSDDFACALKTHFTLSPPDGQQFQSILPATISLGFTYDGDGWVLQGHVENLSFSLLYSFFESGYTGGLLDVFGKLNLTSLDLLWTHTKAGEAASFLFSGVIDFGGLELRLYYQYASKKAGDNTKVEQKLDAAGGPQVLKPDPKQPQDTVWVFECDLGASSGDATIGSMANSIIDDASGSLPSFVSDIKIPKADGANGRAPIMLKAMKDPDGRMLFVLRLSIGIVTLTFMQVAFPEPTEGNTLSKRKATKRLLRVAVDKLPVKDSIPLLDKLPQPFDKLEYLWVNKPDDAADSSDQQSGFLKSEVDAINNSQMLLDGDLLLYKESVQTGPSSDGPSSANSEKPAPNPDPVVLTSGHHFIIVHEGKVAVDHNFSASPAKDDEEEKGTATKPESRALTSAAKEVTADDPQPSAPAKGPVSFKLGPLAVSAVTLQYKEQQGSKSLSITLDATFTMGPITFSLLGFSLAVTLTKGITLDNLADALKDADISLKGLALAFDKPPLLVAGAFEHDQVSEPGLSEDIFLGAVGLSWPPYTFVGLGESAVVTTSTDSYKSVFLFAKLDGPLISLAFAEITGMRLGLGYNSMVRSPGLDELTSFPFINDAGISGTGNNPMALLQKMTGKDDNGNVWVSPKLDSYWFAAGMSITAFDILTVTAVAMLAFRDSGLVASIYADAVATMPPKAPKGAAIVYAEIGMVAEMNFIDGYFRVEAALAPTSYLLVPECRLYGGFALSYWFPPSEHAGDWVFTIGGYHRAYSPPSWYPVPQRLGISFQIDIISIVGEAYFAVTPKCAMGGAMMHASLSFGPISAWLDYAFDALVNFHPLHYNVDFSVSIGVTFDCDILFIHIHISVSVGAQLHIEGPEFGGVAHVDFYLFGFDVDFGASPQPPKPLDLIDFWNMLHKAGPDAQGDHESPVISMLQVESELADDGLTASDHKSVVTTVDGAAHKYSLEDGNFPMPKQPEEAKGDPTSSGVGTPWFVKGGSLQFRISGDYAVNDVKVTKKDGTLVTPDGVDLGQKQTIRSKPMQITDKMAAVTSTLTVTVKEEHTGEIIDNWRQVVFVSKDMPAAIWGSYDRDQDPSRNQRPTSLLNGDGATVGQNMSVLFVAPLPFLCPPAEAAGFIPKFKATAAANFGILDFRNRAPTDGINWIVPSSEPTQTEFLPQALTAEEKAMSNDQRWEATEKTWLALGDRNDDKVHDTVTRDLLSLVASTLEWDQKRPQTEPATPSEPWKLVGNVPVKMVKNLKQTYLDLPRMAVVGA